MIIKIKNKVDLSGDRENKISSIENLLIAHGEGKHHLWMPIEVVHEFLGIEELGYFSKRVLNALLSQVNENRDLDRKFNFYAEVDFEDKHKLDFNNGKLMIGYFHLTNSTAIQEPILLAENQLDGEALLWGARTYLHKERIGALQINLEIQAGGGNTTFDVFQRLDAGRRFFTCIIDSDKDHPKASLGGTAARFSKIPQGYFKKRYFEILECHEIENMIPLSLIKEIFHEQHKNCLIHHEQYIGYRTHPDYKAGLKLSEAKAQDLKHQDNYWKEFSNLDDETVICAGFGDGMLKACVDHINKLSPKKSLELVNESIDHQWLKTCQLIASWGIGGRGLRS